MTVRDAEPDDAAVIAAMVREHAAEEGVADRCHFDADTARREIFGDGPLRALVVLPAADGDGVAGCALWYPTFSSWAATTGIFVEDLFVLPAFRRLGLGRELLGALRHRTSGRIEWDVMATNDAARRFYGRLGAVAVEELHRFRWTR